MTFNEQRKRLAALSPPRVALACHAGNFDSDTMLGLTRQLRVQGETKSAGLAEMRAISKHKPLHGRTLGNVGDC